MSDEHDNHGNSLAAWVCVLLLIVAFGLVSLAVGILSVPLAIAGVVVGIIGLAGVSSSPYVSGSLTAMLILAVVINGVIAVVLGYIGIQVHKGIQKIATGQF